MYKTIAESYEGQSVFITGGTGFLGKVLIEKLLYSCPGIEKVYILIRGKNNESPQQRIQKMLEGPLYSRLRNERPLAFEKIVSIIGDVSEPKLGLNIDDEKLLTDKVSLVFHLAATVKFDETLEEAVKINIGGTERVLDLTRRMKNLKAFIYVSTAFSNTNREVIEEVLYPPPASLDEVKYLIEAGITKKQVEELTKDRPNAYTFTKALAEHVVAKNHGHVPSIIIRPSIVSCSKVEPFAGWVDNWLGATAVMNGVSKGWNHLYLSRTGNITDLIPVDYVSNLMIVAASKIESSKDVAIYNCCTSAENPITFKRVMNLTVENSYRHKFYDIPIPFIYLTRFRWLMLLLSFLLQTIPAWIADTYLWLRGRNVRYTKIQTKVSLVRDTFEYFTAQSWIIHASKTRALSNSLTPSDKKMFPFDPMDIEWDEYISTYCQGIRRFLEKK